MTLFESIREALQSQIWAMRKENLKALAALVRAGAEGGALSAPQETVLASALACGLNARQSRLASGTKGSIAVIPVYGTVSRMGWGASTAQLSADLRQAVGDPNVRAIVLDIDSPGGTVEGVDELATEIRAARSQKKIIACTGGMCASAAYYIASACSEIAVAPSALIGSVGVYTMHEDDSQYLDNLGIKVTLISFGENKVNGNPFERLTDGAKQEMQQMVDSFGGMFEAAVAKGRKTTQANVHATYGQGKVFGAKQAVKIGMADTVGTLDDVLARYGIGVGAASAESTSRMQASAAAPALIEGEAVLPVAAKTSAQAAETAVAVRPILVWPVGVKGKFAAPTGRLTAQQEVEIEQRRHNWAAMANYADTLLDPQTFDAEEGRYRCRNCNKFVPETSECLWRREHYLSAPDTMSCRLWDKSRPCDPEMELPGELGLTDDVMGFAQTNDPGGWGCARCEFNQPLLEPNNPLRGRWCEEGGITLEVKACCNENDPIMGEVGVDDGDDDEAAKPNDSAAKASNAAIKRRLELADS
jgi:signal peptide peptidase SppA